MNLIDNTHMDDPDIPIIKKEKLEVIEDNNENYLEFNFDIRVKVEDDIYFEDSWTAGEIIPCTFSTFEPKSISFDKLIEERFLTCRLCHKFFSNRYSLLKHNLNHLRVPLVQRKLFMCNKCPNFYDKKNDIQNHMLMRHQPKHQYSTDQHATKLEHECKICMKTYPYKTWISHMRDVHGKLKLKCRICGLTFKCESYLKKHYKHTHNGVPRVRTDISSGIQCPKCPAVLTHKSALTTHLRNCHSDKVFRCEICQSKLKSEPYLLTHMRRVHYDDGKTYSCKVCNKNFKSPRYLKVHMKNSHYVSIKKKKEKS